MLRECTVRLLRTGGPLTTAELVHELTVLRRTGVMPELGQVTEAGVRDALAAAEKDGRVEETPADVWHWVRPMAAGKQQTALF